MQSICTAHLEQQKIKRARKEERPLRGPRWIRKKSFGATRRRGSGWEQQCKHWSLATVRRRFREGATGLSSATVAQTMEVGRRNLNRGAAAAHEAQLMGGPILTERQEPEEQQESSKTTRGGDRTRRRQHIPHDGQAGTDRKILTSTRRKPLSQTYASSAENKRGIFYLLRKIRESG